MTKIDKETEQFIKKIVKERVPDFNHPLLHVNARTQMEKVLIEMIKKKEIKPTLLTLNALVSTWHELLHFRAKSLN